MAELGFTALNNNAAVASDKPRQAIHTRQRTILSTPGADLPVVGCLVIQVVRREVAKLLMTVIIVTSSVAALTAPTRVQAQTTNAAVLPPIIALLLDEEVIKQVQAITTGQINDTGVTLAGLSATTLGACTAATGAFAQQDCHAGRDATNNNNADGTAGFSFTKVDENGFALPQNATDWSCVLDNVTGLMWEVKTREGGLRNRGNRYTWFDTNPVTNGGDGNSGVANGGACFGSDCDTESFVNAVNTQGLCGFNDWRMPTLPELVSITDFGRSGVGQRPIDTNFFPNLLNGNLQYWSSSLSSTQSLSIERSVMSLGFLIIRIIDEPADTQNAVRLVRAEQ